MSVGGLLCSRRPTITNSMTTCCCTKKIAIWHQLNIRRSSMCWTTRNCGSSFPNMIRRLIAESVSVWSLGLSRSVFGALALAALELSLVHPASYGVALAVISGLCGILSFLIGSVGVLLARRKRNWLRCRLMGERIRYFFA